MSNDGITMLGVVSLVMIGVLLRPVMRAWARRLGGDASDPGQAGEIAELRERVAELEGSAFRLQELEERVDFAERLLAQRGEAVQLPRDGMIQ